MKVVSLVSQKGGVGKTTLATALAVAAHRDGKQVFLVDLDPQASASFRMDTLEDDGLAITAIPASRLGHILGAANGAGADMPLLQKIQSSRVKASSHRRFTHKCRTAG